MRDALAGANPSLDIHFGDNLPILRRWQERNALGPDDLNRVLPAGTAFVDPFEHQAIRRFIRDREHFGHRDRVGGPQP